MDSWPAIRLMTVLIGTGGPRGPSTIFLNFRKEVSIFVPEGTKSPGRYRCVNLGKHLLNSLHCIMPVAKVLRGCGYPIPVKRIVFRLADEEDRLRISPGRQRCEMRG